MNIQQLIEALQPGHALQSDRWIIARKRDGRFIGGHTMHDECSPYLFPDADEAIKTLNSWLETPHMQAESQVTTIPKNIEEMYWVRCTLEREPL